MRIALLLALACGCAHRQSRLEVARYNVQACEYQLAATRAEADRLERTALSGGGDMQAATARARANQIAWDCGRWQAQVATEQAHRDAARRRPNTGAVIFGGLGQAYTDAGTAPPTPPVYRCNRDYIGSTVCTPQ